MAGFNQLTYNSAAKTAIVGAGWRLGPLYLALWNQGKVTIPAGSCPTVGVAGHALGGGWGFSSRKFGLVSDNILECQLVTADGTLVVANANQNSDLYFALRGAGATSYGIVTQFTFRMNDVSAAVTHFKYSWPSSQKSLQFQNFKAFQTWGVNVPAEISADFYMDPSGQSWMEGTYLGPQSSLPPLVQSFLSAAGANPTTSVQQLTWIQVILVNAGYPSTQDPNTLNNVPFPTNTFKAKSIFVNAPGLSDAGINAMINAMRSGNSNAYFIFDLYGSQSAINKVSPGSSAFVHRSSLFSIQAVAYWSNSNDAVGQTNYIDSYYNAVRPYATAEAYQNYIDKDMSLSAYYGSNLNALITDKKKWDPQNIFNFPQSIPTS